MFVTLFSCLHSCWWPALISSRNSLACVPSTARVLTPPSSEVPRFGDLIIMSIRKHFLIATLGDISQATKNNELNRYQMTWSNSQEGRLSEKSKIWENTCCMMPFSKGNTDVPHVCVSVGLCRLGEREGNLARYPCSCYLGYLRWHWDTEWKWGRKKGASAKHKGKGKEWI